MYTKFIQLHYTEPPPDHDETDDDAKNKENIQNICPSFV